MLNHPITLFLQSDVKRHFRLLAVRKREAALFVTVCFEPTLQCF
jgi:hypothetical protein